MSKVKSLTWNESYVYSFELFQFYHKRSYQIPLRYVQNLVLPFNVCGYLLCNRVYVYSIITRQGSSWCPRSKCPRGNCLKQQNTSKRVSYWLRGFSGFCWADFVECGKQPVARYPSATGCLLHSTKHGKIYRPRALS